MKKLLIVAFCLFPFLMTAQNVGVGTNTPFYKLQVHNPDAANNYMSITNTTTGSTAADGFVVGLNGSSAILANLENGSLGLGTNNFTRILINAAGDVGIGTPTPGAKLDINGGVKLQGLNLFEFGAGVAGKEPNAGKIGYNAFGTNALAFVGAGTDATNRAVYFFAEGGTTFSGPTTTTGNMNIGGQLQLNGSPGADGQVLTSNGTADPTWADAAYNNNTRFLVNIAENAGSESGNAVITSTRYNLNATNVSIGASSITINKTGLYHFDLQVAAKKIFTINPGSNNPRFTLTIANTDIFRDKALHPLEDSKLTWVLSEAVTFDMYLVAPTVITIFHSIGTAIGATFNVSGSLGGYLISE